MTTEAIRNRPQDHSSYKIPEEALDPISGKPMTEAVSLLGCGHVVNEDTARKIVHVATRCTLGCAHVAGHEPFLSEEAAQKLIQAARCGSSEYTHFVDIDATKRTMLVVSYCPFDGKQLSGYVPYYTMRNLAKNVTVPPEAARCFRLGKEANWHGDTQEAVTWFSRALEIHPDYEKAAAYLEYCTTSMQKMSQGIRNHIVDVEEAIHPMNPELVYRANEAENFFSTDTRSG